MLDLAPTDAAPAALPDAAADAPPPPTAPVPPAATDVERLASLMRLHVQPDQVVELRALGVEFAEKATWVATYRGNELDRLAADALHFSGHCRGVYRTVNPLRPAALKSGDYELFNGRACRGGRNRSAASDADVPARTELFVDLDPVRKSKGVATDAERADARRVADSVCEFLTARGWPAPVMNDSGSGVHLFWKLNPNEWPVTTKPVRAGAKKAKPEAEEDAVVRAVAALAARFSTDAVTVDTSITNPSRIVRVPITLNCKGKPTADRPHRLCVPVSLPDVWEPVPKELVEALAEEAPKKAAVVIPVTGGRFTSPADLDAVCKLEDRADRARKWLIPHRPAIEGNGVATGDMSKSGSAVLMGACKMLAIGYALPFELALPELLTWNTGNIPPFDVPEVERALRRAMENRDGEQFGYQVLKDLKVRSTSYTSVVCLDGPGPADQPAGYDLIDRPPHDPFRLAHLFLRRFRHPEDGLTLRYWQQGFYTWSGGRYAEWPEDIVRCELTSHIDHVFGQDHAAKAAELGDADDKKKRSARLPDRMTVTTKAVANTLGALKAICRVPPTDAPFWITPAGPPAVELLPCPNGLVHLPALAAGVPASEWLLPPTPKLFNLNAAGFEAVPDPPEPARWRTFVESVLPDPAARDLLQEWFGLLLTPDTSYQKIAYWHGPPRSGKGTALRVLGGLVGEVSTAPTSFSALAGRFGAHPLIGRTVATIGDARKPNREDAVKALELMLQVSGEDRVPIDRKGVAQIAAKLTVRFVVLSNELPDFKDAAGAFANRLSLLSFPVSFLGREDETLSDALKPELPGILVWAAEGLARLRRNRRFTVPAASREAAELVQTLGSPVYGFVTDWCRVEPGNEEMFTPTADLFAGWKRYCEEVNNKHPGTAAQFAKELISACPKLEPRKPRVGSVRVPGYVGITLLEPHQRGAEPGDTRRLEIPE